MKQLINSIIDSLDRIGDKLTDDDLINDVRDLQSDLTYLLNDDSNKLFVVKSIDSILKTVSAILRNGDKL